MKMNAPLMLLRTQEIARHGILGGNFQALGNNGRNP